MRIDAVELFHLRLPLAEPWFTPDGPVQECETVLVRLETARHMAWGEAAVGAAPRDCPEWAAGAFSLLRDRLVPPLVGEALDSPDELAHRLAAFAGQWVAKGALDAAFCTLEALERGVPLHALWGEPQPEVPLVDEIFHRGPTAELMQALSAVVARPYYCVLLHLHRDWHPNLLRAIRSEFPDLVWATDFDGSQTGEHFDALWRLDDFGLEWIEQPLAADQLAEHARLQSMIRTPIVLDESIQSVGTAQTALALRAGRALRVRPGRVGGLSAARAIFELCRQAHVSWGIGAGCETAIGRRMALASAASAPHDLPAAIATSRRLFDPEPAGDPLIPQTGSEGAAVLVPDAHAGLGPTCDPARWAAYVVQSARL